MSITSKGRGKWLVTIYMGRVNGKPVRRWWVVEGTKKDAERFERERLRELDQDALPADRLSTVAQVCARVLQLMNVAATTKARYESLVEHHIVPHIGRERIEDVRPDHVQLLYRKLLESGKRTGRGGGLSPQTVKHVHVLLGVIFKTARRWRLVATDIMQDVDTPRVPKARRKVIAPELVAGFLGALSRSKYEVPIMLAITMGMRRGEILGLRWSDVDLDAGTLTVAQTLVEPESGDLVFKAPKSDESNRTITLPASTVARLRAHKAAQRAIMLEMGPDYRRDLDLVCAQVDGNAIQPSRLTTAYRGLAALHGLAGVGLHDLRHTHATMLLEAGVDLKVVSARLGHSTITLTADTYSHVTEKLDRDATSKIDGYFTSGGKTSK